MQKISLKYFLTLLGNRKKIEKVSLSYNDVNDHVYLYSVKNPSNVAWI